MRRSELARAIAASWIGTLTGLGPGCTEYTTSLLRYTDAQAQDGPDADVEAEGDAQSEKQDVVEEGGPGDTHADSADVQCEPGWFDCDSEPGCETPESASDCGACDYDCLGAACVTSICEPAVVATGQDSPTWVALDDLRVYWTNRVAGGSVMMAEQGGGTPTVLADRQELPGAIVLSQDRLFWSATGAIAFAGSLMRLNHPYESDAGAPKTLLAGQNQPEMFAVLDPYIFFSSPSTIRRVSVEGDPGGRSDEIVGGQGQVAGIAVAGDGIYWSDLARSTVMRASHSGASEALATGQSEPYGVALDQRSVYWTARGANAVRRSAKAAGGEVQDIAATDAAPVGLVIHADGYAYWTCAQGGSLQRARVDGGPTETLVTGQSRPWGLAIWNGIAVWANQGSGEILRVRLPPP